MTANRLSYVATGAAPAYRQIPASSSLNDDWVVSSDVSSHPTRGLCRAVFRSWDLRSQLQGRSVTVASVKGRGVAQVGPTALPAALVNAVFGTLAVSSFP